MTELIPPAATENPVEHADWLEYQAMLYGSSSRQDLVSQLRYSGTTEALDDYGDEDTHDYGGEQSEGVATDTWLEIESRRDACQEDYPFEVTAYSITLVDDKKSCSYSFQTLLSLFGYTAGPSEVRGDRLFELLASRAVQNYLGGASNDARSYCFGFPRPDRTGFVTALKELCSQLRAGSVREDALGISDQKDSHLDVVAWRPFPDGRDSQLITFGQCATGANWQKQKLTELHPGNFREKWLSDGFYPEPVRAFFLPRCVPHRHWRNTSIDGGIVFDRCRIARLSGDLDEPLKSKLDNWCNHVFETKSDGRH